MGGVFLLAAHAVKERNACASDYRETERNAVEAWVVFEDKIRATAAEVGADRAIEYYFTFDEPGLLFSTELLDKLAIPRSSYKRPQTGADSTLLSMASPAAL